MFDIEKEINWAIEFKDNFKHIPYRDKIVMAYESLLNTDPSKIIKRWWEERDNMLWWIYWWKIYVVWANTWVWKSTFVNQVCNNVSNQWHRVVKYSLEDKMEDIWKEDIYTMINRLRHKDWKKWYWWIAFVNWELNKDKEFNEYLIKACEILVEKNNLIELDKTKEVKIDDLIELMEWECKNGAKLFAIDHLHYFEMDWTERHDLQIQNVMHRINELVRKYDIAVILVAHYRKWSDNNYPNPDEFKDGAAIKQVANIIIQITRDMESTDSTFFITKLRWPIKPKEITTTFNLETFEYDFTKSDKSKDKNWSEFI